MKYEANDVAAVDWFVRLEYFSEMKLNIPRLGELLTYAGKYIAGAYAAASPSRCVHMEAISNGGFVASGMVNV